MKCPNCSSPMFISNENATDRSMVKFYRCTLCVGEHVLSEPVTSNQLSAGMEEDYLESGFGTDSRAVQLM